MTKLQAPIEIEIKIAITNGEGTTGTVTMSLPKGRYPTEQEIRECVAEFESEKMPEGFRMQSKREWFNGLFGQCREDDDEDGGGPTYINFSMPGGENWQP